MVTDTDIAEWRGEMLKNPQHVTNAEWGNRFERLFADRERLLWLAESIASGNISVEGNETEAKVLLKEAEHGSA